MTGQRLTRLADSRRPVAISYRLPGCPFGLADELPYLAVDREVGAEGGVVHAGRLSIGGAVEDDACVGVDELVAGRPPGAVIDGAGGLVAGVELVQEARAGDHLVAGRKPPAPVG